MSMEQKNKFIVSTTLLAFFSLAFLTILLWERSEQRSACSSETLMCQNFAALENVKNLCRNIDDVCSVPFERVGLSAKNLVLDGQVYDQEKLSDYRQNLIDLGVRDVFNFCEYLFFENGIEISFLVGGCDPEIAELSGIKNSGYPMALFSITSGKTLDSKDLKIVLFEDRQSFEVVEELGR